MLNGETIRLDGALRMPPRSRPSAALTPEYVRQPGRRGGKRSRDRQAQEDKRRQALDVPLLVVHRESFPWLPTTDAGGIEP